jgi:hypothetical protein
LSAYLQSGLLWLVGKLLSNGGKTVRGIVGWVVASVATFIPASGIDSIEKGLQAGGAALLAIAYAYFQLWCHRIDQRRVADQIQKAFLADPNHDKIGNETLEAFTARTGVPVRRAEPHIE